MEAGLAMTYGSGEGQNTKHSYGGASPRIRIKKENKGKFTDWCEAHGHSDATRACEEEGLASKSAKTRSRAQFSKNPREWYD